MLSPRAALSEGKHLRHILNISDWVRAAGWATDVYPIGLGREECRVLEPADINHMEP